MDFEKLEIIFAYIVLDFLTLNLLKVNSKCFPDRIHVIDSLPLIWELDGRLVTGNSLPIRIERNMILRI